MNRGNHHQNRESATFNARPGQPPQRPANLGPSPGLSGSFRPPYPNYGLAPRSVMPSYPTLPTHRGQSIVPQPSPNYLQQQRAQNYPFSGGLATQQQQQNQSQQHQHTPLQHNQQSGTNSNVQTHPPPNSTTPNLGTAQSVSSASEVGLDPNDFPALGSTPANTTSTNTSSGNTTTTSYATQVGTAVQLGGTGAVGQSNSNGNQARDFTADDFPALGGGVGSSQSSQQQPQSQQQQSGQHEPAHPPGLNGYNDQSHRQNLLSGLPSQSQSQNTQQQPGLLNLGQQRLHTFQSEVEKRNYALKLNQTSHGAWPSPNANAPPQTTYPTNLQNGSTHQNHLPQQQQSQQHLNPPPGVPLPNSFPQQQQTSANLPQSAVGFAVADTPHHLQSQGPTNASSALPQTPAQQVLISPADRWGLLGLLAMIKSVDSDTNLLSVGTDLGTMGLDMQQNGNLYSTFITPWADSSAARSIEPDFHLPSCYNVQAPPPGANKAGVFSDETLFYMFYSTTRDALQEIAAQELYNRNWRYHKEKRLWLTKEQGLPVSQKIHGGEQGTYTYWDPDNWEKARKDMTVMYSDLEEKGTPAFTPGISGAQAQPQATTPGVTPGAVQQSQIGQRTVAYQALGM